MTARTNSHSSRMIVTLSFLLTGMLMRQISTEAAAYCPASLSSSTRQRNHNHLKQHSFNQVQPITRSLARRSYTTTTTSRGTPSPTALHMHETLLTLADAATTTTTATAMAGWVAPAVTAGIAMVAAVWADGQRQVALAELSVAAQKEPDLVERALDDIDFLQQQQEKVRTFGSILQGLVVAAALSAGVAMGSLIGIWTTSAPPSSDQAATAPSTIVSMPEATRTSTATATTSPQKFGVSEQEITNRLAVARPKQQPETTVRPGSLPFATSAEGKSYGYNYDRDASTVSEMLTSIPPSTLATGAIIGAGILVGAAISRQEAKEPYFLSNDDDNEKAGSSDDNIFFAKLMAPPKTKSVAGATREVLKPLSLETFVPQPRKSPLSESAKGAKLPKPPSKKEDDDDTDFVESFAESVGGILDKGAKTGMTKFKQAAQESMEETKRQRKARLQQQELAKLQRQNETTTKEEGSLLCLAGTMGEVMLEGLTKLLTSSGGSSTSSAPPEPKTAPAETTTVSQPSKSVKMERSATAAPSQEEEVTGVSGMKSSAPIETPEKGKVVMKDDSTLSKSTQFSSSSVAEGEATMQPPMEPASTDRELKKAADTKAVASATTSLGENMTKGTKSIEKVTELTEVADAMLEKQKAGVDFATKTEPTVSVSTSSTKETAKPVIGDKEKSTKMKGTPMTEETSAPVISSSSSPAKTEPMKAAPDVSKASAPAAKPVRDVSAEKEEARIADSGKAESTEMAKPTETVPVSPAKQPTAKTESKKKLFDPTEMPPPASLSSDVYSALMADVSRTVTRRTTSEEVQPETDKKALEKDVSSSSKFKMSGPSSPGSASIRREEQPKEAPTSGPKEADAAFDKADSKQIGGTASTTALSTPEVELEVTSDKVESKKQDISSIEPRTSAGNTALKADSNVKPTSAEPISAMAERKDDSQQLDQPVANTSLKPTSATSKTAQMPAKKSGAFPEAKSEPSAPTKAFKKDTILKAAPAEPISAATAKEAKPASSRSKEDSKEKDHATASNATERESIAPKTPLTPSDESDAIPEKVEAKKKDAPSIQSDLNTAGTASETDLSVLKPVLSDKVSVPTTEETKVTAGRRDSKRTDRFSATEDVKLPNSNLLSLIDKLSEEEWGIIKEAVAAREDSKRGSVDTAKNDLVAALEEGLKEDEWDTIKELVAAQNVAKASSTLSSRSTRDAMSGEIEPTKQLETKPPMAAKSEHTGAKNESSSTVSVSPTKEPKSARKKIESDTIDVRWTKEAAEKEAKTAANIPSSSGTIDLVPWGLNKEASAAITPMTSDVKRPSTESTPEYKRATPSPVANASKLEADDTSELNTFEAIPWGVKERRPGVQGGVAMEVDTSLPGEVRPTVKKGTETAMPVARWKTKDVLPGEKEPWVIRSPSRKESPIIVGPLEPVYTSPKKSDRTSNRTESMNIDAQPTKKDRGGPNLSAEAYSSLMSELSETRSSNSSNEAKQVKDEAGSKNVAVSTVKKEDNAKGTSKPESPFIIGPLEPEKPSTANEYTKVVGKAAAAAEDTGKDTTPKRINQSDFTRWQRKRRNTFR